MNYNIKNSLFENNYGDITNNKSLLVSKKIETYFDDLIKAPEIVQTAGTNDFSFSKFYNEYIEHNLLLLFIILCLVIFLIIKYINKNYYNDNNENFTLNQQKIPIIKQKINKNESSYDDIDTDTTDDYEENYKINSRMAKQKFKKEKLLKLQKENERQKHLLELEKQSIIDIIDELSNINNQKIIKNTNFLSQQTQNNITNPHLKNVNNSMYIDTNYLEDEQSNFSQFSLISSNEMDFNDNYYNVRNNINYKDKNSPNYVKGMYIESPYQE